MKQKSLFCFCMMIVALCRCHSFIYADDPPSAIVVLVSNPESRQVKTRLAAGLSQEEATTFYQYCLSVLTEDLAELSKDFTVVICPATAKDVSWARKKWPNYPIMPQPNTPNLGERIQTVMHQVLHRGYGKVMLIASDAPSLPVEYIYQCYSCLSTDDMVLAPAKDGGFYLIGTAQHLPDLKEVRWSTEYTFNDTMRVCTEDGMQVAMGPMWYDIDVVEDLWLLERDLQGSQGKRAELLEWIKSLPKVTVVIPVLNEEQRIPMLISLLVDLHPPVKIICVDGGSKDGTVEEIRKRNILPICLSSPNRGRQLNAALPYINTPIILFLHADTTLTQGAYTAMLDSMRDENLYGGAFSYALEGSALDWRKRVLERGVWLRTRVLKMPYGDQAYFIKKTAIDEVGSFKEMPLMEDLEWFERLKNTGKYVLLDDCVYPSPRRIFKKGWIWSSVVNLSLVMMYKLGVDPQKISDIYYEKKNLVDEQKELI